MSESVEQARCEAKVWDRSGWHRHTCMRIGTTRVGTGWYCAQHAKIAERRIRLGLSHL